MANTSNSIGRAEVGKIVERLLAIYRRVAELRERTATIGNVLNSIDIGDLLRGPLPTRIQCVTDAETGLGYAAWCIGEVLMHAGGLPLMDEVFSEFEMIAGDDALRAGVWLNHRWDGVSDGTAIWTA